MCRSFVSIVQLLSYTCGKTKNDRKEKERRTKSKKFLHLIFSSVRRINGTPGVYFTVEYLRAFIYKSFVLLYCCYLGAAAITYVQDAILNLPNPYLRSTTILLDKNSCVFLRFTVFFIS